MVELSWKGGQDCAAAMVGGGKGASVEAPQTKGPLFLARRAVLSPCGFAGKKFRALVPVAISIPVAVAAVVEDIVEQSERASDSGTDRRASSNIGMCRRANACPCRSAQRSAGQGCAARGSERQ